MYILVAHHVYMQCEDFRLRDDFEQLAFAWRSREAPSKRARQRILDEGGSRWTEFMCMPGWLPVSRSALDYMHNFYRAYLFNLYVESLTVSLMASN